jgi:hypothetical protein
MARVGPRWRHRGILHRPGRVRWHRKEWCDSQHWQGGWASSESSHSRVGDACCLQQACPLKRSPCFHIDREINLQ